MQRTDLPESTHLVTSDRLTDLVDAIALAIAPTTELTHVDTIHGDVQSRLFLPGPLEGASLITMLRDRTPTGIATWLLEVKDRNLPYPRPTPADGRKGWEIRKALFNGAPGVIATAAWVTEPALA